MIVHVVSWSPSMVADGGSGGFEWRRQRVQAIKFLHKALAWFDDTEHTNVTLCVVDVPANTYGDQDEYITRWIDSHLHLVEPSVSP